MARPIWFLVLLTFWACQNTSKNKTSRNDNICSTEETSGVISHLVNQFKICPTNQSNNTHAIWAANSRESRPNNENILHELLLMKEKPLCAPGPFLLSANSLKPSDTTHTWIMDKEPDYFIYTKKTSQSLDFSLTQQNGMPIKSKVIALKEGLNNFFILIPQKQLSEGVTYYLYLKNMDETKWIQPFRIEPQAL